MQDIPQYDHVYVISDIHMGGPQGFQILRETERLANFIRWIAAQQPDRRVALILNGDVIDTLAEKSVRGYIAFNEALPTIQGIMDDPSFSRVWKALADFVKQEKRTLVIVIGNHDIELAFPLVQRLIVTRLAGDDLVKRARIEFATTGAGYLCSVGNSRIFCTHGNEVDAWNYIRYEDLTKAARRLNTGRSLDGSDWEPNAGTKMVKDVMNTVKETYAWIDLLKPEAQAAVGTLLALDPSQLTKIKNLIPIVGKKLWEGGEVDQRLSAEGFQPAASSQGEVGSMDRLLGPNVRESMKLLSGSQHQSADDMLLAAERSFEKKEAPTNSGDSTLGTWQYMWDRVTGWIRGVGKDEALRKALMDWVQEDTSFDISNQDDTYEAVSKSIGSNVDFLVTGHTHLERAIDMGAGRYYFNCGTWIRLLRLTNNILNNSGVFKQVYEVLMNGRMETIDTLRINGEPFVMDQTSAVSIGVDVNRVVGQLLHVEGDGTSTRMIKEFVRP